MNQVIHRYWMSPNASLPINHNHNNSQSDRAEETTGMDYHSLLDRLVVQLAQRIQVHCVQLGHRNWIPTVVGHIVAIWCWFFAFIVTRVRITWPGWGIFEREIGKRGCKWRLNGDMTVYWGIKLVGIEGKVWDGLMNKNSEKKIWKFKKKTGKIIRNMEN